MSTKPVPVPPKDRAVQGRTFPSKGETITVAGLVIKDKYIASVSGDEFRVRCHVTAYNINTGQQVWRASGMGPDEDVRLAPDFNAANPY